MSEKTEQPTPKKLRDARKKGQVAKSKEVGSAAVITGAFLVIWIWWDFYLESLKEMIVLPARYYSVAFHEAFGPVFYGVLDKFVRLSLPVFAVVFILAILANFFQIGALFAVESIKPSLKKISPAEGLKKIFSLQNLVELLKSVLKIGFLSLLIYVVIKESVPALLLIPNFGIDGLMAVLAKVMKQLVVYTIGAFVVVAVVDYFFQRAQHVKKLKMTKDEVKREYKEMEGDPFIKSKRKQMHREMAMADTLEKTRKASVLITNPTRLAIALLYDEEKTKLPMVTAKGENLVAKRMIEIAREEGIPIMQDVPLARDLFERGDINQYIPSELIKPVAEVLRWVRKVQRERTQE